jgi:LacI family transcriptional regulator
VSHRRGSKATQADVARLAGVSQAAVSYALSGGSYISVSQETRQRILDAVEQLGYVPDGPARSLRTRKTYAIAGIIPDITNPFYPAFQRGIQEVAEEQGYDLIPYHTDGIMEKELKCLRSAQGRADGVVAVLFHVGARELAVLLGRGIAVARLQAEKKTNIKLDLPLDNIYVDNTAASQTAVEYLIGRGHRRIGMLSGERGPGRARACGYRNTLRKCGYRNTLRKHRIPLDEALIRDGGFKEECGYEATKDLMRMPWRPTAVFAANDKMAMGCLMAIRESDLRIPEDIALVGFDDTPSIRLVTPPLTTVTQFQEELGRRAAEMLFERLEGEAPKHGRYEEMPFELVVRDSA